MLNNNRERYRNKPGVSDDAQRIGFSSAYGPKASAIIRQCERIRLLLSSSYDRKRRHHPAARNGSDSCPFPLPGNAGFFEGFKYGNRIQDAIMTAGFLPGAEHLNDISISLFRIRLLYRGFELN